MDEITIDPSVATVISNRRYRRSSVTTEALAFQCAHVQEGLTLDALIVADDIGERWVGAGDRALCRFLARNAPELAAGEADAALKLRALQTISEGLEAAHVTTARIKVPKQDRHVFVTAVGYNRMRNGGVVQTAHGTQRILGYRRPIAAAHDDDYDAGAALQDLVDGAFERIVRAAGLGGPAPENFLGMFDDRVYRDVLNHILAPAIDALAQSGLVVDDIWRNYRLRSREQRVADGIFERHFRAPMRESRSGVRLGDLEIRFFHRHDTWDISHCPQIRLAWR